MFARQNREDQSWWIPVIEKAYAKINSNYERLGLGWMEEAMRVLTGAPSYKYTNSEQTDQKIWDLAFSADGQKFLMTAASDHVSYGLAAGHAYTLLGCYELKDPQGKVIQRLLHMRNPWATDKYNGPWNENDQKWTP